MLLPPTLFHSKSIQSTSLSILIHTIIGIALYFGLYTVWSWNIELKEIPPEIYIAQQQVIPEVKNGNTVVVETRKAIPPEEPIPEVKESLIDFEEFLEKELSSFKIEEPKPWMPAQLRLHNNKPRKHTFLKSKAITEEKNITVKAKRDPLQSPPPEYPILAQRKGIEGVVILTVEIREDGQVTNAYIASSSGYKTLDVAAFEAVRTWKYLPAFENGVPKKSKLLQRIIFKLRNTNTPHQE